MPNLENIEQDVIDIIVEQLSPPNGVSLEKSFTEDLNADSLDLTELIMAFEEYFGIEIPQEDAEKLQIVGDVVEYVKKRLA